MLLLISSNICTCRFFWGGIELINSSAILYRNIKCVCMLIFTLLGYFSIWSLSLLAWNSIFLGGKIYHLWYCLFQYYHFFLKYEKHCKVFLHDILFLLKDSCILLSSVSCFWTRRIYLQSYWFQKSVSCLYSIQQDTSPTSNL